MYRSPPPSTVLVTSFLAHPPSFYARIPCAVIHDLDALIDVLDAEESLPPRLTCSTERTDRVLRLKTDTGTLVAYRHGPNALTFLDRTAWLPDLLNTARTQNVPIGAALESFVEESR